MELAGWGTVVLVAVKLEYRTPCDIQCNIVEQDLFNILSKPSEIGTYVLCDFGVCLSPKGSRTML